MEPCRLCFTVSVWVGCVFIQTLLIVYSGADSWEKPFLLRSAEELEPFLDKITDEMLKVTLREGVGYLHEGLNSLDHDIVTQLFEAGWIQVCVLNSSMCWGVTLLAHLVVVMGTQYYVVSYELYNNLTNVYIEKSVYAQC